MGEDNDKVVIQISVDSLKFSPFDFRQSWPDFPMLEKDIKENGVKTPLLICPNPDVKGLYNVIDGNTRLKIAQRLKIQHLPAINLGILDEQEQMRTSLVTNLLRKNLSPKEIADAVRKYKKLNPKKTNDTIAVELSMPLRTINTYLAVGELSSKIQSKIADAGERCDQGHQSPPFKIPLKTAEKIARFTKVRYPNDEDKRFAEQEKIVTHIDGLSGRMQDSVLTRYGRSELGKPVPIPEIRDQAIREEQITMSVAVSYEMNKATLRFMKDRNHTKSQALRLLLLKGLENYGYVKP